MLEAQRRPLKSEVFARPRLKNLNCDFSGSCFLFMAKKPIFQVQEQSSASGDKLFFFLRRPRTHAAFLIGFSYLFLASTNT